MDEVIPLFRVAMDPAVGPQVERTLLSGFIAQGPKVDLFEQALADTLHIVRPVTVNSGTAALTLAMHLAGVGPGRTVITTPMTCSATNLPILNRGADILWADVDPHTGLIDPDSVRELLRSHAIPPAAIVAVDWGGQPADYDELRIIADQYGVPVISDAAHSIGALYKGISPTVLTDYTCYSFQAIKHLTTGDGGALTVPASQLKRAKNLRWFGIDREAETKEFRGEVDITEAGYKFHMNDIAATIGLANLRLLEGVLKRHRATAATYNAHLDERFVRTAPDYDHTGSWWIYTVLLRDQEERDAFKAWMPAHGVQVSQVHWRNDRVSAFKRFARDLPGVDEFSSRMICLPAHWQTRALEVVAAANSFFDR